MGSLLDLLFIYPIQESLLMTLPLGDLFNLAKTNSLFRAVLHGFQTEPCNEELLSSTAPRQALLIGRHGTPYWKNLKSKSPVQCSEPHHVRGDKIRGCRMCSMPVCEACIIKVAFGKRDERTFSNRTRSFCRDCYDLGNTHKERLLNGTCTEGLSPYLRARGSACVCTAKDGHLCLKCKTKQKSDAQTNFSRCHGEGCSRTAVGGFPARICLWCNLCLPDERSRAETRRDYDSRHLLARTHSTYEYPSDEELIDPAEQEAFWASMSPAEGDSKARNHRALVLDPFEDSRQRELNEVSLRRSLTAEAAEEARWRRSEVLRRAENFDPRPPILRRKTNPTVQSSTWRDTDSMAPTLVDRDYWESSDHTSYDPSGCSSTPEQSQYEQSPKAEARSHIEALKIFTEGGVSDSEVE